MSNPYFAFKQFTVFHDQCAMKVGTDGVLLGAWVDVENFVRILDVGTGTGLIAIMCAQRSGALIDAVEIDVDAYKQALKNVSACPWKERIRLSNGPFQLFAASTGNRFDLIVSNPPYFRNSLRSPNPTRSLARHDHKLTFESLLFYSSRILTQKGRVAVIIPAGQLEHMIQQAYFNDLHPMRKTLVRSQPGKDPSRCLVEFSRVREQPCITDELTIKKENSDDYTEAFKALTKEFYLNF